MHSFYISLPTFSPIVLTAQSLLLATVSQMVFLVNKQNIVSMHYQYVSLLCVCAFQKLFAGFLLICTLCKNDFLPFPFYFVKVLNLLSVVSAPIGYASIYGDLQKLEPKKEVSDVPFVPSDRPWETIFSGSSHVLPPLTKLCSAFLSSLLEKRPVGNE